LSNPIQVIRTRYPFWQRTVFELWDNLSPVVSANNYLRSNLVLSDHTLADKAYSFVLFFRFLQRNSLDFFDLSARTLRLHIIQFRNELLFRVRASRGAPDERKQTPEEGIVRPLNYPRAKSVLAEVGYLCEWWGLIEPRPSQSIIGHGKMRSPNSRRASKPVLPDCFQISILRARKRFRENHALEPSEVEAIWSYLTSEARPVRLLRVRRILRKEVEAYISRMLPEFEAAKDGGGALTREQLAEAACRLSEFHRLLDLCDASLDKLRDIASAAAGMNL
jgi:hypothetical protein